MASDNGENGGGPQDNGSSGGGEPSAVTFLVVDIKSVEEDFTNMRLGRGAVDDLAASIEETGLLQPLVVRFHPEYAKERRKKRKKPESSDAEARYQLVAGARRMAALRSLGYERVEVTLREDLTKNVEVLTAQLDENIRRETLSPIEVALGIKSLVEEYRLSQKKAAERLGMERSKAIKYLRLLDLERGVQMMVHKGSEEGGLDRAHGEVIYRHLGEDKKAQQAFADRAASEHLDYRTLERYIKEYLEEAEAEPGEELVEDRKEWALDPTPTPVLDFYPGFLPEEGDEESATLEQAEFFERMVCHVLLCNAYDHDYRSRVLGLPVPFEPQDYQEIWAYVEELPETEVRALNHRLARRYFTAGHRATRIPIGFAYDYMQKHSSNPVVEKNLADWKAGLLGDVDEKGEELPPEDSEMPDYPEDELGPEPPEEGGEPGEGEGPPE